jgi:hypothetical protein
MPPSAPKPKAFPLPPKVAFIFSLILILFLQHLSAQDGEVFNHPLNENTKPLFVSVCKNLSSHRFVKGNFEQTKTIAGLSDGQERRLVSAGNFVIAGGTGMIWETLAPFPSTLAAGKNRLVQQRPGGKRTVVSAAGNETFLRFAEAISAVFSGDGDALLANFDIYFSGSGGSWTLGLLPKEKSLRSFAASIVMQGGNAIDSIYLRESSGGSIAYILKNHTYPTELTADENAFFAP